MSKHYVIMRVGQTYAKVPVEVRNGAGTVPIPPVDPPDEFVTYAVFDAAVGDINNSISVLLNKFNSVDATLAQHTAQIEALQNLNPGGSDPVTEEMLQELQRKIDLIELQPGGVTLDTDENGDYYVTFFANPSENLEHYILEKFNETTNKWDKYDNATGIVH